MVGLRHRRAAAPGGAARRPARVLPHLYNESITLENSGALISIERGFALARAAADHYGAALWSGEWGWFGDPGTDGPKVVRYAAAEDAHRARRRLVGVAAGVRRPAQHRRRRDDDGRRPEPAALPRRHAARPPGRVHRTAVAPFPRAAPGRLTALSSSSSPRRLSLTGTTGPSGNCRLDVWIPGDTRPDLTTSGMTSMRTVKVPGGWRITACATDTYHLQAH
ncbi:hypothetical protein LUX57_03935 [Actinomadura madurae]|uniref:hypothetical protein n=1 Tax=Actinomadura madurae TaxID=1993 RepID=UPI0020D25711|nr:hypothetical protein [Actinomadura madurae]MCP9964419.1 hypothetical protein [Actinomadura madurae]